MEPNISLSECIYELVGDQYIFNTTLSLDKESMPNGFYNLSVKHTGSADQMFYTNRECIPIQVQCKKPATSVDVIFSCGKSNIVKTIEFSVAK